MYNDSIEGVVPRKKIRIREYPETSDKKLYLEIKNKYQKTHLLFFIYLNLNPTDKVFP